MNIFKILGLLLTLSTPLVGATDSGLAECILRIRDTVKMVPGEIGGRPEDLLVFIGELKEDRKTLAAASTPDADLIARLDKWIEALEQRLRNKKADVSLPGYGLIGFGRLDEMVLGPSESEPDLYQRLAVRIRTSPRFIPGDAKELLKVRGQVKREMALLRKRGFPEDLVLVERAGSWLAGLNEMIRIERMAQGPANNLGPTRFLLELGQDDARRLLAGLMQSPRFMEVLERTSLGTLEPAEVLYYFSTTESLFDLYAELGRPELSRRIRIDPAAIAAPVRNLTPYTDETEGFRFLTARVNQPADAVLLYVSEEWIKKMRARLAAAKDDLATITEGRVGLLGVSTFEAGGLRLAPSDPDAYRFIPTAPPIDDFLTPALTAQTPAYLFAPRLEQLPPHLADLEALLSRDRSLRSRFRSALPENPTAAQKVVALVKDDTTRRLAYTVSGQALALQSRPESRDVETGILFLGAGLVEQNAQNVLLQSGARVPTLTVERDRRVLSTFARGGYAVALNSSSRPIDTTGLRQRVSADGRDGGDLNFLPAGIVQLNQFEFRPNPVLLSMAEAGTINRGISPAPVWLETDLKAIKRNSDGKLYALLDGNRTVTPSAFIYTGIGDEKLPDVPNYRTFYDAARAEVADKPGTPPGLMNSQDLLEFILSTSRPYSPFSGKVVAVFGEGDSGKAVQRWLNLLSAAQAYGSDTREIAIIAASPWFGQSCTDCNTFINGNRAYYADLGRAFRSGRITAKGRLAKIAKGSTKRYRFTDAEGNEVEADYGVSAIGFLSALQNLLSSVLPANLRNDYRDFASESELFRLVMGYEPSLGEVPIARQLVLNGRPEAFYLLGPAAGFGVVTAGELERNQENSVANTNHNWRVALFMQALARQQGIVDFTRRNRRSNEGFRPFQYLPASDVSLSNPEYKIEFPTMRPRPGQDKDEVLFAAALLNFLRFRVVKVPPTLTITFYRPEAGSVRVSVQTARNYEARLETALKEAFQDVLLNQLLASLLGADSAETSFTVNYAFGTDGALDPESTSWSFR